jgi:hypothetical protein
MSLRALLPYLIVLSPIACGEGGSLAISAGAPVSAAVRGRITDCGRPVPSANVLLAVQQDLDQARPVDARIGPHTTAKEGHFFFEVSPPFAVPGSASMQLQVTVDGITDTIAGGTLEFRLGAPPRDTARFDADLGVERGTC